MRRTILASLAVLGSLLFAGSVPTHAVADAAEPAAVSPRTEAVLRLDHLYGEQLENQGMLPTLETPMNTAYNYATATKLFWHSVSSYCTDDPSLKTWECTSCSHFGAFNVTAVMDDTTNQGYVGYFKQGLPSSPIPGSVVTANEPFVLVSFRGTIPSDLSDWIEDLSFSKLGAFSASYPDVKIHSGFWGAYQEMKPKMMAGLATAFSMSGARTLLVTGHSLGAAMAELAALDLVLNEYPDKYYASYTQGTPRPGNAAFATLYGQKIGASFREIHQADIVPHLPPKVLGFIHGVTEVWFDKAFSSYKVCSGTNGEDPTCSDSLLLPTSVADHLTYRNVSVGSFCTSAGMTDIQMPTPVQVDQLPSQQQQEQPHKRAPRIVLKEQ